MKSDTLLLFLAMELESGVLMPAYLQKKSAETMLSAIEISTYLDADIRFQYIMEKGLDKLQAIEVLELCELNSFAVCSIGS